LKTIHAITSKINNIGPIQLQRGHRMRWGRQISSFIACCQRFDRKVLYTQLHRTVAS